MSLDLYEFHALQTTQTTLRTANTSAEMETNPLRTGVRRYRIRTK